jgi:signal transduction histidine kinase
MARIHLGVRGRTALIATLTVGVVIAAGSALFVLLFQHSLAAAVDTGLLQQARTTADAVRQTGPTAVDISRAGDSNVVQLLDGMGTVLRSSPGLEVASPLTLEVPVPGAHLTFTRRLTDSGDEPYRILVLGLSGGGETASARVVVVAQSLDSVNASTRTAAGLLAVGVPALLLLVAALTYWLSGRALRPVERMRRQVADIDGDALHVRVPLPAARDEVWRLAGTMNTMLDRLEEAAGAQRRFVSDASHELRSPLAALRASVEVGNAHPETTDWQRTADVVLVETLRLERLVSDLLLLARSDERGLQLRREDVDLDDIVNSEADRLHDTSSLAVLRHVTPLRVRGDRDGLARAVRNLVDNASRHASSSITLTLSAESGAAVIDVIDDGPGIAPVDRERVFERFVRVDDSRSRSEGGSGLGLAITRQLAQAHGGTVVVVDTAAGAHFQMRLPLPAR